MSNVIPFTVGKKTVADVIQEISDRGATNIVVLGWDRDNKEFFIGTIDDGAEVNWLLDRLKFKLMLDLTVS